MTWTLSGKLEAASKENPILNQCRVEAFFDQIVPLPEETAPSTDGASTEAPPRTEIPPRTEAPRTATPPKKGATAPKKTMNVAARVVGRSDERGEFTLRLPDKEEISSDTLQFIVSAPSGETISDTKLFVNRIKDEVRIPVRSVKLIVLEENPAVPDPADQEVRGSVRGVTGRIIERNGRSLGGARQVLLFGTDPDKRERAGKADVPLLATRADTSGYFSGEVPNREFGGAFANVSGVDGQISVPLERDRIPARILLVVDIPEQPADTPAKTGDCTCADGSLPPRTPSQADIAGAPGVYSADLGTGRCVEFNTPNRAIEEFNFYTVVRTTEPDIRGYTVEPVASAPVRTVPPPPPMRYASAGTSGQPTPPPGVAYAAMAATAAEAVAAPAVATLARRDVDEVLGRLSAADLRLNALAGTRLGAGRGSFVTPRAPGRMQLDGDHPVDWDSTPTFYEASTISHGHLLHFKQVWYADGYSLGDLLYSLPLAPGQKKLVSVIDWERREQTTRREDTFASEGLVASLSRDRDLSEVVTGALSESARGGSKSTSAGVGVGTGAAGSGSYQGFNFGALIGISGGYGESNSSAWQDSARTLSSTSLQGLRDRTLQSASAVRSLRSSVVHTASQGEAVTATTEVVANHNHCHAITIQYFEVLRHLKVAHELADVHECLFIPLPMSVFDRNKALRWRQSLQAYLQRREFMPAFDAARRVETGWSEVNYPVGRYADELVTAIAGEMRLTVTIPLPPIPELPKPKPEDTAVDIASKTNEALNPTTGFLGAVLAVVTGGLSMAAGTVTNAAISATQAAAQGARALAESLAAENSPQRRYERFQHEIMPGAVAGFVNTLELYALVGGNEVKLAGADFTLVSEYQPGVPLLVSLRGTLTNPVTRAEIRQLIIKSAQGLPEECRAIINTATIRYQTGSFEHGLVNDERVNDDIDPPGVEVKYSPTLTPIVTRTSPGTGAALYTPLDGWEQRSPRIEDIRLATELIEHLNDNLEYYHNAIWWTMDPNRRFMLLDGYLAPGSNDRSVASVVENRLIGIVGNSLVMPVAEGIHLDPRFAAKDAGAGLNLLEHYKPVLPSPASRVSLPTRGVFAEAVMGSCNACEKMDDSLFWRWEESPIDEPPSIEPASTATRRTQPDAGQPTPFPTPIVSIQTAQAAPDPAGVRAALDVLTRQSFADITGLAGTQANAAAAYAKAMDTALAFGKEASTLAQQAAMQKGIDRTMSAIDKAETDKKIDPAEAKQLRVAALKKMVGDSSEGVDAAAVEKKLGIISGAAEAGWVKPDVAQDLNKDVLQQLAPGGTAETSVDTMMGLAKTFDGDRVQEMSVAPDGSVKVINADWRPGESKTTAPAQKTGMSGLGNEEGKPTSRAQKALEGSQGLIDLLGDTLANWKDSPSKSLTDALADTLAEAAKDAADEITDEIPFVKAMKVAVKYSLVFADGIGAGIDTASKELAAQYLQGTDYADTGDGIKADDYEAIRNCERWPANSVAKLNQVVLTGVKAVVSKALEDFPSWLSSGVTKKIAGLSEAAFEHLINKSPLKGALAGAMNAAGASIPAARQEMYRAALSGTFNLFIRQVDNPKLRKALKPLGDATDAAAVEKALIKALASCLTEAALGDPEEKTERKKFLQYVNEETKQWAYQVVNRLLDELPGTVTVVPTQGALAVTGNQVQIPAALLSAIRGSGSEAAEEDYRRWMHITLTLAPIRAATQARLTLWSRVKQPQIVALVAKGGADEAASAYEKYAAELRKGCAEVTRAYLAAGWDPQRTGQEFLTFDMFQMRNPLAWYTMRYDIIHDFSDQTSPFNTPEPKRAALPYQGTTGGMGREI